MLKANLENKLLVAWLERIESTEAQEALRFLVGFAACSSDWVCHPRWKGYLPDFRFHERSSEEQFFSFVPAQQWLLFYFRKPAIISGQYEWPKIVAAFPEAEQKAGEWRVRVRNIEEARKLVVLLEGPGK